MVRVLYRWKVEPENFAAFETAWNAATNRIHETVRGAQGSFLLRGFDDATEVLTVAKWDSLQDWEDFWQGQDPQDMKGMRALGERISAVAYEEVDDHTR